MTENKKHYDIIIIGAGMAGISMALALKNNKLNDNSTLRIAILEKNRLSTQHSVSFDDRSIALSKGSANIFQTIGIWQELSSLNPLPYEAIQSIHIAEQGKFGTTRMHHLEHDTDALGYVIENQALGNTLLNAIKNQHNVDIYSPVSIKSVSVNNNSVNICTNKGEFLAHLLIAADGQNSVAHQFLKKPPVSRSYHQCAIISNIETQYPHQGVAYERFTPYGPLAVLPLTQNRCSLVWTVEEQNLDEIMALSETDFIHALQHQFGYRLGKIKRVGKRVGYPLSLKKINYEDAALLVRTAFIGNSAHNLHPVSGQGFNLSLRDIRDLSRLIHQSIQSDSGKFEYQHQLITDYCNKRQHDVNKVTQYTDSLVSIFSNQRFPLTPVRNIGLHLLHSCQPIKQALSRFAMGYSS